MGQGLGQAQNPEVGAEPFEAENKRKVLKSCDFRTFMAKVHEVDTILQETAMQQLFTGKMEALTRRQAPPKR